MVLCYYDCTFVLHILSDDLIVRDFGADSAPLFYKSAPGAGGFGRGLGGDKSSFDDRAGGQNERGLMNILVLSV